MQLVSGAYKCLSCCKANELQVNRVVRFSKRKKANFICLLVIVSVYVWYQKNMFIVVEHVEEQMKYVIDN